MAASNGLLIRNAAQIVTGMGAALRGGALRNVRIAYNACLYAENGLVSAVGSPVEVDRVAQGNPTVIDAGGKAVIPGFIDAHTHAVFAGSRVDEFVQKIAGVSYADIAAKGGGILNTVAATRAVSKAELKELTRGRLKTALEHGTTTMEIKSGYGLDLENEVKMLDVIAELGADQPIELLATFLGAHAIPPGLDSATCVRGLLEMIPRVASKARFCDAFCDAAYFPPAETRAVLEKAKAQGLRLMLHAGQFEADGGVRLAIELGAAAVAHLDFVTEEEIALLGRSSTAALLLPGVSLFGATPFPPARKLIDAGALVALATNFNPGSCPSISMPMMIALACLQMKMSPAEALNAATVNAAAALGLENVGTIEPGRQADLAILDVPDYRMIPYYFGVNPVSVVVKKGRIAWQR